MNISFLHLSVIIFQPHILHESLHHHMRSTYFLFAHTWSLYFPLQNKNKKKGKYENSRCILSCIYSVPWANHVGIINPFHLKTKWLNMVPNACLTKKGCFFGHLNFIITFFMHSLKYARVIHPYEMLLKYWRSELPFLGLRGWTKLTLLQKGSSSQVEIWK